MVWGESDKVKINISFIIGWKGKKIKEQLSQIDPPQIHTKIARLKEDFKKKSVLVPSSKKSQVG